MHQIYSLPSTKVIGLLDCRVPSKIHGILCTERSWGDVKTIKPVIISSLGSDLYKKQIIVYPSACIEKEIIGRDLFHTYSKDGTHSYSWNDEDHAL